MERFYDPTAGCVLLDDEPIQDYGHKFLHNQMSLVAQEPVLFSGTIGDNIRYGNADATQDDVERAARDANAHEFISELDKGYDTDVGEAGGQLSGASARTLAQHERLRCEIVIIIKKFTCVLHLGGPSFKGLLLNLLGFDGQRLNPLVFASRWSEAEDRHRPGDDPEPEDFAAGRGDERAGHGVGAARSGGAAAQHGGAHRRHHRAQTQYRTARTQNRRLRQGDRRRAGRFDNKRVQGFSGFVLVLLSPNLFHSRCAPFSLSG